MTQTAWETAMGMRGYRGSPAEREDQRLGIKIGGRVRWFALEPSKEDNPKNYPLATITDISVDQDGDPWFELELDDPDHKPVRVSHDEIMPLCMAPET